ncbi:MAG: DNA-processing protein DprA [Acidimicrobiales bacterium]
MTGTAHADGPRRAAEGSRHASGAGSIFRVDGDVAYVVALCGLPGMGHATLRRLLETSPAQRRWAQVCAGTLAPAVLSRRVRVADAKARLERWRQAALDVDPDDVLRRAAARGVASHVLGDPTYPAVLAREPDAPVVCFTSGGGALARSTPGAPGGDDLERVAIVGTRSATHYGAEVAAELGAALGDRGICIVSGLAAGIDAAAHEGALASGATPPLAVVGGGVDVVYPACNRRLWTRVSAAGTILSEAPPGGRPEPWRFPLRNRLVAAFSDLVVVVEAHRTGGAMHTVDAALARGVVVAAVPGSVRSPASEGTNALIADGSAVVRDVDDIMALLALARVSRPPARHLGRPTGAAQREGSATQGSLLASPPAGGDLGSDPRGGEQEAAGGWRKGRGRDLDAVILAALDERATGLETIVCRTGLGLGDAAVALERLVESGAIRRRAGAYERLARPIGLGSL